MGIILLINHGADVYAKDRFGLSVSDIAYTEDNSRRWLGSARGDIWDFALALSGYNISDFRQGRHRKARYGTAYTRQDFETLWAGHEHLCPYYDIEDYYDEDADSRVSSDDENDEGFTTDSEDEGFTTDSEDEGFTTDSEDGGVDVVDMEEESPSASYSERETGSSGGI
ncbi:hypothetical protein MMYC01_208950 [Madurella mycetomatis]|uniref:Uncharacterized protein n=1 Tax=Madurella mycetomatis TaxID=100816 RepID=A0A175VTR4_9PEZI|nr:hypothetical protein MMYC01_208950 [Madurella mycetomatis]